MNYFTKNRILLWIVVAAFAINISAIVTILYHVHKVKYHLEKSDFQHHPYDFFKKELSLSPEQETRFMEIRNMSRTMAEPIVVKMKEQQIALMNVLSEKNTDTLKIKEISDNIQQLQALLLQTTINHYLDIKKILKDNQQEKLNFLYQDLFGCPRMEVGKKCGNACGKGEGKGKGDGSGGGKRHRHGGGWDKNNDL